MKTAQNKEKWCWFKKKERKASQEPAFPWAPGKVTYGHLSTFWPMLRGRGGVWFSGDIRARGRASPFHHPSPPHLESWLESWQLSWIKGWTLYRGLYFSFLGRENARRPKELGSLTPWLTNSKLRLMDIIVVRKRIYLVKPLFLSVFL